MRPQKALNNEVLSGLAEVFCSKGYEGASLQDLALATGLKKASLYHRFPNGKQEMGEAVFLHLDTWVGEHVFQVLNNTNKEAPDRLTEALSNISELYDGGNRNCIFRALSMQSGIELFGKQIQKGVLQWIAEFENIALDLGFSSILAKEYAMQSIIEIQGSLVMVKAVDDTAVFDNTLKKIAKRYLS